MNYSTLQASVQSFMGGRSDVPAYIYELTHEDIMRDFRFLEMQSETTLTGSAESVTLPTDFMEAESLYIETGGTRIRLTPTTEGAQAVHWDSSGIPATYAIHDGEITLMPVPDSSYTLTLRYYARLDQPSADSDENDIMALYPGLYLYGAATHAAIWASDTERMQTANAAYGETAKAAKRSDKRRRMGGGPMHRKSVYAL